MHTVNPPKVSVIIPTYNRPHLVSRAIRSVLEQSYQDFEVIVVDDGLDKRSKDVIEGIGDGRVRYIENVKSEGAPASRNRGAKESRGDYLAFLDDDDEWSPHKLELQIKGL